MKDLIKKILKGLLDTVRVVAFLLVLTTLIIIWNSWFRYKSYDGSLMMENFYEQPENSIDMLCIGSSHTFVDINTGVLWNEQGIPSYVLGGSLQPFWNSYYYLVEALKTQRPGLVVLEALAVNLDDDYSDHGMIINNIAGMHMSMNKLEAIRASVTDTDGVIDNSLLFEEYHERYTDLELMDIADDLGDEVRTASWKGFYDYYRVEEQVHPSYTEDVDPKPMTNKQEYYYRLIIEYCQAEGIPLLIIVSPDGGYCDDQRAKYLYAADIAEEYGVDFIDFNEYYDDIGLDPSEDFGDIGHLNYSGNRKFTSYFGEYLDDNYDLPDRRNDNSGLYDSWEENYRYLESRADNYVLRRTFDVGQYYSHLSELSDDYEIFVYVTDNSHLVPETVRYLGINGISCQRPFDSNRYLIQGHRTTVLTSDDNGLCYEEFHGDHHLAVCEDSIYYDTLDIVEDLHEGVVIVTYDTYNGELADSVVIVLGEVWRFDV